MAPAAATRDMYLNAKGNVDNKRAQYSHLSAGVPGTVMGLLDALEAHGTMSRKQVLAPAIKLATHGFEVSFALEDSLNRHTEELSADPVVAGLFSCAGTGRDVDTKRPRQDAQTHCALWSRWILQRQDG